MASEPTEICIVGGGIAGLSAAFALQKMGIPYVLLEGSGRWGGVIRTDREEGFLLEAGPDALLAAKPDGVNLCKEVGLSASLIPTNPSSRQVFVLRMGRLLPMPEGMLLGVPTRLWPFLRSPLMSWPGKMRMGFDLFIPPRRTSTEESIAEFIQRRFGREALEWLAEPLLAGIHAGDPAQLSMRAAFPRFVELEARQGSLIRGLLGSAGRPTGPAFYSLEGGLGDLVAAVVARLDPARIRLSTPVKRLSKEPGGLVVETGASGPIRARAVILALPPLAAAPILSSLAPEEAATLAKVPFASTATILLGYRREDVAHSLEGYGFVVPRGEGLRTTALTFVSTKFEKRAPEGHVLIRAFVGGARDPEVLGLEDGALLRTVKGEMAKVLGLKGEPVVSRVYRWPHATPQIGVGHLETIGAIREGIAASLGVILCGAGIRVTGIPDCVAEGARAAEELARLPGAAARQEREGGALRGGAVR